MGTGDLCRVPPAAARHGRARQSSGTGPNGIVEGYCGYRARGVSIQEKSFYRESWGTRRGDRHVAKRSSDPRVAYPEFKVQVRDTVRVVGIVASFATRVVGTRGKCFCRVPGSKWAREICAGCPQQRYTTGESGKVQGRDRKGIVEESCGYRARGVSIQGKFVLSRNLGYGGSPVSLEDEYQTMVARHYHSSSDSEPLCSPFSQEERFPYITRGQVVDHISFPLSLEVRQKTTVDRHCH